MKRKFRTLIVSGVDTLIAINSIGVNFAKQERMIRVLIFPEYRLTSDGLPV